MIKVILTAFLLIVLNQMTPLQDRVKAIEVLCKLIDNDKELRPLHIDSYIYNKWKLRIGASGEEYFFKNDSISKIEYYKSRRKLYDEYTFYFNKGELIKANTSSYDYKNDRKINLEEYSFYFEDKELINTRPEGAKEQREIEYILNQAYYLHYHGEEMIKDWSHRKE